MSRRQALCRLGEVAEFLGGSTPSRAEPQYFGGGIPWVKTTDLNNGYVSATEETLTDIGLNESACKMVPANSVLVAMYGGFNQIGRTGLLEQASAINQALTAIVPDSTKLMPEFLLEWLNFRKSYWKRFAGSSRKDPNITKGDVADFPVPILSIDQQADAVRVLRTWNGSIRVTEQLATAKDQRKLAAMSLLLTGQRRLNGFKRNWRNRRLGELFVERAETNRADLPLLSIASEAGIVPRNSLDRRDTSNEDKAKYLRICPGDIGYNTMRMWQGVSALSRYEGIVSPAYTICVPGAEIDGKFASYLFKLPAVVHRFYRYSQGLTSDTWNLKFRHFAEIEVRIPEVAEQVAIASALTLIDQELDGLKRLRSSLAQQKRGLMQKLLTGEWRLPLPGQEAV